MIAPGVRGILSGQAVIGRRTDGLPSIASAASSSAKGRKRLVVDHGRRLTRKVCAPSLMTPLPCAGSAASTTDGGLPLEESTGRRIEVERLAAAGKHRDAGLRPLHRVARQPPQNDRPREMRADAVEHRLFLATEIALVRLAVHADRGHRLLRNAHEHPHGVAIGHLAQEITELAAPEFTGRDDF
jgi:hypothetical protein